jgi:hypothetical protein
MVEDVSYHLFGGKGGKVIAYIEGMRDLFYGFLVSPVFFFGIPLRYAFHSRETWRGNEGSHLLIHYLYNATLYIAPLLIPGYGLITVLFIGIYLQLKGATNNVARGWYLPGVTVAPNGGPLPPVPPTEPVSPHRTKSWSWPDMSSTSFSTYKKDKGHRGKGKGKTVKGRRPNPPSDLRVKVETSSSRSQLLWLV